MKKVLMLALFTMVILGCVFSATFEMYQAVDDFGDPVGEKIIRSKTLNGTYKTSSVQDGKMSYTISITKDCDIQIRIVEAGNTGNLVGAKYTSDTFSVTIRPDSGSDVTATASIKQGDDKKYNILQFSGASALAAFTDPKSVRIVIKNDKVTYSLGTVDTSEVNDLYIMVAGVGRGPAGGWIFYDKGYYSDGWRYLEAAPADLSEKYVWGPNGKLGTARGIGTGKSNTDKIPAEMNGKKTAAQACREYSVNGYDDWFLPSKAELDLMFMNLKENGIGGFSSGSNYWSSSESSSSDDYAVYQNFSYGNQYGYIRDYRNVVRPVRAF